MSGQVYENMVQEAAFTVFTFSLMTVFPFPYAASKGEAVHETVKDSKVVLRK